VADVRNRIKELRYVDTADIVSHPGNWRDHPEAQANALAGVLREVGIADALLAYESERNGGKLTLIDGHLRKDAAPGKWPVLVLDVDDAEADYVLATFDSITSMAVADKAALDSLLSAVNSGEAAVQQMLADEAQKAGLYIEPFGDTSTERDKQHVATPWDQVNKADNEQVVIGDIETRLPADVVSMLSECLNRRYIDQRTPIFETLEAVIVAGVRAVEAGNPG